MKINKHAFLKVVAAHHNMTQIIGMTSWNLVLRRWNGDPCTRKQHRRVNYWARVVRHWARKV